jgi:single-strand DNA-binding protein
VNREGAKVYTTDVVIEEQEFAESKAAASNYNAGQNFSSPNTSAPSRPAPSEAVGDGFMNIPDGVDDEGLPFN